MSFWIVAPLAVFLVLGLRRRPPGSRAYGWVLIVVLCVLAYEAISMRSL